MAGSEVQLKYYQLKHENTTKVILCYFDYQKQCSRRCKCFKNNVACAEFSKRSPRPSPFFCLKYGWFI